MTMAAAGAAAATASDVADVHNLKRRKTGAVRAAGATDATAAVGANAKKRQGYSDVAAVDQRITTTAAVEEVEERTATRAAAEWVITETEAVHVTDVTNTTAVDGAGTKKGRRKGKKRKKGGVAHPHRRSRD